MCFSLLIPWSILNESDYMGPMARDLFSVWYQGSIKCSSKLARANNEIPMIDNNTIEANTRAVRNKGWE